MPLFVCAQCGVIDNTAVGNYWARTGGLNPEGQKLPPLCTLCDPAIGAWHDRFPRLTWQEYLKLHPDAELLDRPDTATVLIVDEASAPEKQTRRVVAGGVPLGMVGLLASAMTQRRPATPSLKDKMQMDLDALEGADRHRRHQKLANGPHQGSRERARRQRQLARGIRQ